MDDETGRMRRATCETLFRAYLRRTYEDESTRDTRGNEQDEETRTTMRTFRTGEDVVRRGVPKGKRVVLLGESTHGTEEFYAIRAEMTKRLIENEGFRVVVFEADGPTMHAANEYVHRRRQSPFPPDDALRFPSWMWKNQVMLDFYEWCRRRAEPPLLIGMDCYSLIESKRALLEFLDKYAEPALAKEVRARLALYVSRPPRSRHHTSSSSSCNPRTHTITHAVWTDFDRDKSTVTRWCTARLSRASGHT